jgi:hypothetical protein
MSGVDRVKLPNDDEDWRKEYTLPEEDRRRLTTAPWTGGYRWFRSSNVVCLETWRLKREKRMKPVPGNE